MTLPRGDAPESPRPPARPDTSARPGAPTPSARGRGVPGAVAEDRPLDPESRSAADTGAEPAAVPPGTPPRPASPPPSAAPPATAADAPRQGHAGPDASAPGRDAAPEAARSASAGRRAVGAVDLTPGPSSGRPFVFFARPETFDDSTTRLRPIPDRHVLPLRMPSRVATAAACMVLGLGLIGGAVTGSWLTGDSSAAPGPAHSFAAAAELWHGTPVDRLFPPVVHGDGAGPGGADRTWTRVAVAPDSGCSGAFDPLLNKVLAPVGCLRLLRATYTDATRSSTTTVGLLFTKADPAAMRALRHRFTDEGLDRRSDLMPRPYAAKDTAAAGFGEAQRASWTVSVLTEAPVIVWAVTGFADGRTVQDPQPAADAMRPSATTAPAQAGLGFDAKGLADRIERGLRKSVSTDTEHS